MSKKWISRYSVLYLHVRAWVWHQWRHSSQSWRWHTSTCPHRSPPERSWLLWRIPSACCPRWRFGCSIGSSAFLPWWCSARTSSPCTSTWCSLCTCGCSDRRQRRSLPTPLLPPPEQTAERRPLPAWGARASTGLELQKGKDSPVMSPLEFEFFVWFLSLLPQKKSKILMLNMKGGIWGRELSVQYMSSSSFSLKLCNCWFTCNWDVSSV